MENISYTMNDLLALDAERASLLIEEKKFAVLKTELSRMPAPDVAELIEELAAARQALVFRLLSKEHAAEVFVQTRSEIQLALIDEFTDKELSDVLSELYLDDTVDLIEEMPASVVKRIIKNAGREDRDAINTLLRYPRESAGSVMTTEYVRFRGDMTVSEALSHIREVAYDKETIYTCYVTDTERHLLGIVTAKRLLVSGLDTYLRDIMNENVISVHTHDPREDVAHRLEKYGLLAMPVVDSEQRLVGIITVDDAIDVLKEESEADFAVMAAVSPSETPYLHSTVGAIFKSRVFWLLLLMVSSTLSSAILSGFETALPATLVLFVPMIMGTGGNSGGQSSVTIIRSISLSEVAFSDIFRVVWKELRVGILSGVCVGGAAFLKVVLVDGLLLGNENITVPVALTVSISLAVTIIVAKMVGASLPLLAKRIGLDPAVMASPLITTLVDAISLVIYFFVASSVIKI